VVSGCAPAHRPACAPVWRCRCHALPCLHVRPRDVTWRPRRGLAALGALTQMRALDLSDTAVTSAGMGAVARMRGLHTLALSFGGAPLARALLSQRRAPRGRLRPRGGAPCAGRAPHSGAPLGVRRAPQPLPPCCLETSMPGRSAAALLPEGRCRPRPPNKPRALQA